MGELIPARLSPTKQLALSTLQNAGFYPMVEKSGARVSVVNVYPGEEGGIMEGANTFKNFLDETNVSSNKKEVLLKAMAELNKGIQEEIPSNIRESFQSGHFDEPNILAHVRMNDRKIGKDKVLFLEEVQSDWHQEGQKTGYRTQIRTLPNNIKTIQIGTDRWTSFLENTEIASGNTQEATINDALIYLNFKALDRTTPDAPFKKTWHEMVMKRMVRQAVEEGKDGLAWTTGAQQAERYPSALRKRVDLIKWQPKDTNGPNGRKVRAVKDGKEVFVGEVDAAGYVRKSNLAEANGNRVEDIIGKDMTRKVMAVPSGEIPAKDFTLGGQGLFLQYDQKMVQFANDFFKKWGAKVESTKLSGKDLRLNTDEEDNIVQQITGFSEVRTSWSAIKNNPYFTENGYTKKMHEDIIKYNTVGTADAQKLGKAIDLAATTMVDNLNKKAQQKRVVHYLRFTPALKRSAMKQGFPLFTGAVGYGLAQDEDNK